MKRLSLEEFLAELKGQGVAKVDLAFVCPACGTVQSARDLIEARAGKAFDDVEKYLGFSCIGRFTHGKPPPRQPGSQRGCNWTLGGLLPIHALELGTCKSLKAALNRALSKHERGPSVREQMNAGFRRSKHFAKKTARKEGANV